MGAELVQCSASVAALVSSPDLEVFQPLSVHFVDEEVWELLSQLVETEEETLDVAELQFGLFVPSVLPVLCLFRRQRHELLQHPFKTPALFSARIENDAGEAV